MKNAYPWYDSPWLNAYVKAKHIINQHYPQRLKEFVDAFEPLRTRPDFQVIKFDRVFDQATYSEIQALIKKLKTEALEKQELFNFGRMVVHDHSFFNRLQDSLTGFVSDAVKEPVESSYNFLSLYNNLGNCQVHMDAPSAKWTLDICLDQSAPWPIYFSQIQPWPEHFNCGESEWSSYIKNDSKNVWSEYNMQIGEGVLFSGSSQWHYRNRIPNISKKNYCYLVFFHFIPKGTRSLTEPENWADLFGIPELKSVVDKTTGRTNYTISDVLAARNPS